MKFKVSGKPNPFAGFALEDMMGVSCVSFLEADERKIILVASEGVVRQVIVFTDKQEDIADIMGEILYRIADAGLILKPEVDGNDRDMMEHRYPGKTEVITPTMRSMLFKAVREGKDAVLDNE